MRMQDNYVQSESLVNVEIGLFSPTKACFPKGKWDELTHLNFDIDGDGKVCRVDSVRSVSNLLMKVMGKKGLWKSFFNKKKEEFDSIKQPGSSVNFLLVLKIKNSSDLFSQIAFGMNPDEYVNAIGDSKGKVSDKFVELAKEVHSYISLLYGKESILVFRAVMDKSSPRFFVLVVPIEGDRVVPYKEMDLSKDGLKNTRTMMQNEISSIVASYI